MHYHTDRIIHTTAFVTPVEREIVQWVHPMKDRSDDHRTMSERAYHGATSRSRGERNVLQEKFLSFFSNNTNISK